MSESDRSMPLVIPRLTRDPSCQGQDGRRIESGVTDCKDTDDVSCVLPIAELDVTSNYSFLRGASQPSELAVMAAALGYEALGIADRNSLAGVVRMQLAAEAAGLRLLVGTRLVTRENWEILCYPTDRAAYGRLCRLLTLGKRRAAKGDCTLHIKDVLDAGEGQRFVLLPPQAPGAAVPGKAFEALLERFAAAFSARSCSAPGRSTAAATGSGSKALPGAPAAMGCRSWRGWMRYLRATSPPGSCRNAVIDRASLPGSHRRRHRTPESLTKSSR